jgi:hypothetical protein
MTSTFYRQLAPCARNVHSVWPPPVATHNSSPAVSRTIGGKAALDRKLGHETQAASLKAPIALEDGEESRQLRDGLAKAARERKHICQAILLMMALFMLSLAGLGYCALLLPHGGFNPTHFATLVFSILGLASLIAQLELFGYLLWHRIAVNHLHKKCRRRVLLLAEPQLSAPVSPNPAASLSATEL